MSKRLSKGLENFHPENAKQNLTKNIEDSSKGKNGG
jgi:hypothetical protein